MRVSCKNSICICGSTTRLCNPTQSTLSGHICAVDHDNNDYAVFESGAILMYLAEKCGRFYPQDFNKRHEVNQWLFFQNAGARLTGCFVRWWWFGLL